MKKMLSLKPCVYQTMKTTGKNTLLPEFDALVRSQPTLQMEPLVQQLLCTSSSSQSVCHGVCFKIVVRKFDTKISMLMNQFDKSDIAINSGNSQKRALFCLR